jgi:DHA2 family multidrug resistance protein
LFGVLLGTFISTLTSRLSVFGLNDVRGAVHAGFDEGAWITTSFTVAQMLITPVAVWVGSMFGPRPILMLSALVFAFSQLLTPFAQNLQILLALQFISGLGSGCFIPLTLSFILRNMPLQYWAYGIALYALNLELSLNISASLEGWYIDHLNWHWIFWQNVPLALGMGSCLYWGAKNLPPPANIHRDIYGLLSCGTGFAVVYAALDQGNRVDWTNSGLFWGLSLAGMLLLVCFVVHELTTEFPWIDFKAALRWPMPLLLGNVALLRLCILTTAYLIPYYLGGVRGYRALQVGDTLIWIAAPQLIICALAALMLRRLDPRITAVLGLCLVVSSFMSIAWTLTPGWGSDQFLVSQLMQAVGQSFALSGLVFIGVLNMKPQDALTFGASLQIARLFGGEIGSAFVSTEARLREQHASNVLGQHIRIGDPAVQERLAGFGHLLASSGHQAKAAPRFLANTVRTMATTQATIDTYAVCSVFAVFALLSVVVLLPNPPRTPASHIPLFKRNRAG